jgi:predicted aldo/keto reductase-like oxidoreductase
MKKIKKRKIKFIGHSTPDKGKVFEIKIFKKEDWDKILKIK